MTNYRKKLYTNYFTNQAGRDFTAKQKEKFEEEKFVFANEIIPYLHSDKSIRILDIGCGTGSLIAACKDAGFKNIEGIDISEEMVKIANDFGVTEARYGDLNEYLSDKQNSYDVISGMDIIEHFTKDELLDLIETIKNALKPEGVVVFRTPNTDAPFATIFSNGDFTHENFLNKNSVTQLMMAMGFHEIQVLPSYIKVKGFAKEFLRKIFWNCFLFKYKLELFASARSSRNLIFTPNMIIVAKMK